MTKKELDKELWRKKEKENFNQLFVVLTIIWLFILGALIYTSIPSFFLLPGLCILPIAYGMMNEHISKKYKD